MLGSVHVRGPSGSGSGMTTGGAGADEAGSPVQDGSGPTDEGSADAAGTDGGEDGGASGFEQATTTTSVARSVNADATRAARRALGGVGMDINAMGMTRTWGDVDGDAAGRGKERSRPSTRFPRPRHSRTVPDPPSPGAAGATLTRSGVYAVRARARQPF